MRRLSTALLFCLLLSLAGRVPARAAGQTGPTVFAAASLTNALQDIAAAWAKQGHPTPLLSFASSSILARQIAEGAPVNIYASADEKWMNYLAQHGMIVPGTRRDLLRNDLVLIVPANHPTRVKIGPGFDLAPLLGPNGRLAVGDPAHVPAGIYARQALQHLGLWANVEPHLARAEDVRAALLLVERGEAPAGIVYGTDAAVSRRVMIAGIFPPDSHPPITYPFAIVKGGDTAQARAFFAFLQGPQARALFARRGFPAD